MTAALLSIGRFARLTGLTAKALRHYDRIGLLRPAEIDPGGYRRYAPEQVGPARRIALLRGIDVPIEDVRRCLEDERLFHAVLAGQRRRLDARLTRVQRQLHTLNHLLIEGSEPAMTNSPQLDPEDQRRLAAALFNGTWQLLEQAERTPAEDDEMLHMAHASRHHWGVVGQPVNLARGEWQCSRVYAVLGRPEPCLHHAQRVLDLCTEHGMGDFDHAFAYEALARGSAVAGDLDRARAYTEQALAAADGIAEDEDRELVLSDLESIPGQDRFW